MLYAICNPTAGNGRAKKAGLRIENILKEKGIPCRFLYTERPGQATDLARQAVEAGAKTVLAIGGDGTAFETAQGLLGWECALGVIPAGTGNDFAKTLGSPLTPEEALEFVLSHPVVSVVLVFLKYVSEVEVSWLVVSVFTTGSEGLLSGAAPPCCSL